MTDRGGAEPQLRPVTFPCHHRQEQRQAAPPGMTLEGQPIRRGAAPRGAALPRDRAPQPGWKGVCEGAHGGPPGAQTPTPFALLCTFEISESLLNAVLLCDIGNKDGRTLPGLRWPWHYSRWNERPDRGVRTPRT